MRLWSAISSFCIFVVYPVKRLTADTEVDWPLLGSTCFSWCLETVVTTAGQPKFLILFSGFTFVLHSVSICGREPLLLSLGDKGNWNGGQLSVLRIAKQVQEWKLLNCKKCSPPYGLSSLLTISELFRLIFIQLYMVRHLPVIWSMKLPLFASVIMSAENSSKLYLMKNTKNVSLLLLLRKTSGWIFLCPKCLPNFFQGF